MSRFSAGFLKSIESDYAIATRETRKPTEGELRQLKEMDNEVHCLQDEVNRLQDLIREKRKAADAFSEQIYGIKTFKVKKARK